jgi:hypothetical protein
LRGQQVMRAVLMGHVMFVVFLRPWIQADAEAALAVAEAAAAAAAEVLAAEATAQAKKGRQSRTGQSTTGRKSVGKLFVAEEEEDEIPLPPPPPRGAPLSFPGLPYCDDLVIEGGRAAESERLCPSLPNLPVCVWCTAVLIHTRCIIPPGVVFHCATATVQLCWYHLVCPLDTANGLVNARHVSVLVDPWNLRN